MQWERGRRIKGPGAKLRKRRGPLFGKVFKVLPRPRSREHFGNFEKRCPRPLHRFSKSSLRPLGGGGRPGSQGELNPVWKGPTTFSTHRDSHYGAPDPSRGGFSGSPPQRWGLMSPCERASRRDPQGGKPEKSKAIRPRPGRTIAAGGPAMSLGLVASRQMPTGSVPPAGERRPDGPFEKAVAFYLFQTPHPPHPAAPEQTGMQTHNHPVLSLQILTTDSGPSGCRPCSHRGPRPVREECGTWRWEWGRFPKGRRPNFENVAPGGDRTIFKFSTFRLGAAGAANWLFSQRCCPCDAVSPVADPRGRRRGRNFENVEKGRGRGPTVFKVFRVGSSAAIPGLTQLEKL